MREIGRQDATDLTNCDREPIHIPGSIQPHGVLLALHEPAMTISQVSENAYEHLERRADEVLGQPLSAAVDQSSAEAVLAAFSQGLPEDANPVSIRSRGKHFDGILHRHEGAAILELEPASATVVTSTPRYPLRAALRSMQRATTLPDLCQVVVEEVRRLTGFERVMLYRFDEAGHGSVEAEAKDDALEPYLNLHYPASDIPQQARQLYLKNWLRIIPDARYAPVRIVPELRPDTRAPLDLTFAVLRSVSPIHLEFMANMGTLAAMSISLIVRQRLWGLISCVNHTGRRLVPFEQRSACETLGRLMSLQLAALEDRQLAAQRASRRETRETLDAVMRAGAPFSDVLECLLDRPVELMALVGAEGVAVVHSGKPLIRGRSPSVKLVMAIRDWLEKSGAPNLMSTESLSRVFPEAEEAKDVASGLLTFALPDSLQRRVMWFRPEMVRTVHWAGDPGKPVESGPSERLRPRRSFQLWKEQVMLRSLPWTASDIEAAEYLRRNALEVDIGRRLVREERAVQTRDEVVAVVSHDLKNSLGSIRMQAARMQRSALGDDEPSRLLRISAVRIESAVASMNAIIVDLLDLARLEAEQLAMQSEDSGELVEETLTIMRPQAEAKRITLAAELVDVAQVSTDRRAVFQALSNLVGNAIKFTPEGGRVTVRTERHEGELWISVIDTGPGISPDDLHRVFDRYWRARGSDRQGSGLGLGLYVAKRIVEAHGGRIWVEIPDGGGTTFNITLPIIGA